MDWFLESIYPTLLVGVLGLTITAILLVQTGQRIYYVGLLCVIALCAFLLATEFVFITDREQIENSIDELASALEANDIARIKAFLSSEPDAQWIHDRAEAALMTYRILKAKVRELKVQVRPIAGEATAEFDGIITGEFKLAPGAGPYARRFIIQFRHEPEPDGPWKAYKFEEKNMLGQP